MNNHELQIVTFDQAKKLKALGFDWRTEYDFSHDGVNNPKCASLVEGKFFRNASIYSTSAPTVALALKWIRDVKGILNCPEFDLRPKWAGTHVSPARELKYTECFDTYEAAESGLLDAILEALEENDD